MKHLVIVLGLCLMCNVVSAAPVRAYYNNPITRDFTYLENDFVKITIAKHQGKIVGWFIKSLGVDAALVDTAGWGMVAQRLGVFDAQRAGLNVWPDTWPTPAGTGDYQTRILLSTPARAVVMQSITIGPGFVTTGLHIDKYYVLTSHGYNMDVFYVVSNMSRHTVSSVQDGQEFGITLTVETTCKLNDGDSLRFRADSEVVTSPIPLALPPGWDQSQPIRTKWCAVENLEDHYLVGSTFVACETHGLWPGESRPGGADYEVVFNPVIYRPGQMQLVSFTVYGGPGTFDQFRRFAHDNEFFASDMHFKTVLPEVASNDAEPQTEIETPETPKPFGLCQNYPNPFNPTTIISYQLAADNYVTLKVYDVLGREVATLVNENQNAGTHQVTFDATNLPSGIYFCRITAGAFTLGRKMILMR